MQQLSGDKDLNTVTHTPCRYLGRDRVPLVPTERRRNMTCEVPLWSAGKSAAGWKVGNWGSRRWQPLGKRLQVKAAQRTLAREKTPYTRAILDLPV